METYMRSHTWNVRPGVDPALHAVGELRVPLRGRPNKTRVPFWVLDYSFVTGTFFRLNPRHPWQSRLAGECHLYPPDITFHSKSDPSHHQVSHSIFVLFEGGRSLGLSDLFRAGEHYGRFLDPQGGLGRRLRVLVEIGIRDGDAGFWKAQSAFCRLIDQLIHHSVVDSDGDRVIVRERPDSEGWNFIARVDRFLRNHAGERLTRQDIAGAMGVSVSTLAHRYRNLTGVSPMQRLIRIRVDAAKTLLRGGQPLKAIAATTGCYDEFHLSKLFKSIVGMTPRQYLKLSGNASSADHETV